MKARNYASLALKGALVVVALLLAAQAFQLAAWQRKLQGLADARALYAMNDLKEVGYIKPTPEWFYRSNQLFELPRLEYPPKSGFYRGDRQAFRATVTAERQPFLMPRAYGPLRMEAQATAALLPTEVPGETRLARVE